MISSPILAIADTLQKNLESGVVSVGSRLPTHRDLANHLGGTARLDLG